MIVVTTPTGNIGQHVLRGLLQSDETVRVIVREAARLPPDAAGRVDVVVGSLDENDVLQRAFAGAEAVFWCVPQSETPDDVREHYLRFARPACASFRAQDVRRVVAVSSGGYGRARNAGPISALHAVEAMIEETGTGLRALRNGSFMENLLWQVEPIRRQGAFFFPLAGDVKMPVCAACDIAASAVRLLRDRSWIDCSSVGVHGPEDLCFNEMAYIMTEVLERPIRFQEVPASAFMRSTIQHGSSEAFARGLVDMFAEISLGIYAAEPRTPETTTSTTFRQWCAAALRPAIDGGAS